MAILLLFYWTGMRGESGLPPVDIEYPGEPGDRGPPGPNGMDGLQGLPGQIS